MTKVNATSMVDVKPFTEKNLCKDLGVETVDEAIQTLKDALEQEDQERE